MLFRSLIAEQLVAVTSERDSLRSRLSAARLRVDALLERLPAETPAERPVDPATPPLILDNILAPGAHP